MKAPKNSPKIRELFIEELAEVQGGGPVEELLDRVAAEPNLPIYTTMACGEEASSGC